jgi:glyoxylate reductase
VTTRRIVMTRPLPGDPVAMLKAAGFENLAANQVDVAWTAEELRTAIAGAHAIITTPVDRVDDAALEAAGRQLVIVSNYAVGVDNIDLAACRARGVIVGHTPNAVTEPTADIAWLLLLGASRRAWEGVDLIRSGQWTGVAPLQLLGTRVLGKTLFIVGAGRIGFATARRSIGWNMNVIYHARSRHPEFEAAPIGAKRVSLDEGLAIADFVSIHTPLTAETRHLFNAERLSRMKPGAILVNTARGAVIDEGALVEALRERRLAAVGLDVYEREPRLHPGLADLPNVFLLPHLGSATREDREWMMRIAVENAIAALAGRRPAHMVE